jgi:hypothetical protein
MRPTEIYDALMREPFFKKHWHEMLNVRENSPWHREANVAEHTRMVLNWYEENLAPNRNSRQQLLTTLAILFHDAGKPVSETIKFTEERGFFKTFSGHEHESAIIFGECFDLLESKFDIDQYELDFIQDMIEHHLPYSIVKKKKISKLRDKMIRLGEYGHRCWIDLLLADQHGRISDNHSVNIDATHKWIDNWLMTLDSGEPNK